MAVICICGVCVPYSVLWPLVLLMFKPIFDYVKAFFGYSDKHAEKEITAGAGCCPVKDGKSGTFSLSSDDNWSTISNASSLTFIRFTASWCIPCKNIEPLFLSLGQENPSLNFVSVDVDKFDEIAAAHSAFAIPLFIALHNGKEIGRLSGKNEDALKKFIVDSVEGSSSCSEDSGPPCCKKNE
mmetsp:Transcript_20058/g.19352  ORF Transcript_20058/g.19352 Transcript_20058/m.19352 type:complete len:183 (-) Transcript_20058:85-633(-)